MRVLRIPLRVVFYREDGDWIAHCLEFDVCGDGQTQDRALRCLNNAIQIQVDESLQHKNLDNLFRPAPGKFFQMFAAGTNIAVGQLRVRVDDVEIEDVQTREYQEDGLVLA